MNEQPIYVTDENATRLRRLLETKADTSGEDRQHLQSLADKLDRAVVVSGSEVPAYVVTMRSRVRLKDLDTGRVGAYTLVHPGGADIGQGKVSVLTPVGATLLGGQELDAVACQAPAGRKRFRIEQVLHQPEAVASVSRRSPQSAGRYDTPSAIARALRTETTARLDGKLEA